MLKIILGLLPGILFVILFACLEKNKTKKKFLKWIILLIIGSLGSYLCYRLEMHFGSYFKKVKESTYLEIVFYAIFGVAIFEEGYKWFLSFCSSWKEKNVFSYSIFASIGFATFENIVYYAIPYNLSTVISRMTTAFPSHILNAIWMGIFFEQYKKTSSRKKYRYLLGSLAIPILTHAFYNSFLYGEKYTKYFSLYYISYLIITIVYYFQYRKRKNN